MSASPKPPYQDDYFSRKSFSRKDCLTALHGEMVPHTLCWPVTRVCTIRGIRHKDGFGEELRGLPEYPEFTRALNARSIMSNKIPTMKESYHFPYCIWYPDLAEESTYRELGRRYPQLRYNVGRACAVAGYVDLYRELDLLPDVSIAEEARDNQANGKSRAIFDDIMASPIKFSVMDDYTRSVAVDRPRAGACLNADTAVRSILETKHGFCSPVCEFQLLGEYQPLDSPKKYFNITEDWGVGDREPWETSDVSSANSSLEDLVVPLLYSPLPIDLPNINKDLLILRAAYSGNIDRYSRLQRPIMVEGEVACILRGIYHETMFAKWWSLQPESSAKGWYKHLRRAINARFIMNNDLSRITDETPEDELPYVIYYPSFAHPATYEELLRRKPSMLLQVARAYIVTNDERRYRRLNVPSDDYLFEEAYLSLNPYFKNDLRLKGADFSDGRDLSRWKMTTLPSLQSVRATAVWKTLTGRENPVDTEQGDESIWEGLQADFGSVELFVSVPDSIKQLASEYSYVDLEKLYRDACYPDGEDLEVEVEETDIFSGRSTSPQPD